ncbi:uncharacterized protein BT62DRAFT_453472 [Guyanagaster necrorhizus]|uniref:F-box domain-containing protein n=1 Tax=Guyanagaster necrorhizus TaxID=856835 RepID=A0A9P7VJ39_9AGAR|nr:uncharacterized protein BT62DRAFT_453472 [Guyanagaster necrorhizus MCA 3950]KAG7442051.1 hypothetical protein BT62DRAFT_453472 [Guyanagaster necrorhizus MCA 3950]
MLHVASDRIEQLDASVGYDKDEEAHLKQLIDAYRSILSPLRTFPSELLMEIFQHAVEDFFPVFDLSQTPWVLCRVCQRWRDVSRSCAELWASLSMEGYPQLKRLGDGMKDLPAILEDALDLSRQRDLSIRYSLTGIPLATDSQLIRRIVGRMCIFPSRPASFLM